MHNYKSYLIAGCSALGLVSLGGGLASAQTTAATDASTTPSSEVVVTARKRVEKLLDVPISITAFTSKDLESQAIYSIQDLANETAGLTLDSTLASSDRNDRSFPTTIIRGMVPSLTTNPTTTIFVDGAPLISGQIDSLDDLERVEVLKGPQSAFFGRETFAGAISLVTKDPTAKPSLSVNLLAASPNYYDERVTLQGSLLGNDSDKLTGRVSYRYYSRQGSWDNEAIADKSSQKLGDQSTQSVNVEVVAKPIENLKIKALGIYWHDKDGPSAQGLILSSQANCLNGTYFCGTPPGLTAGQPASNDIVTPPLASFLKSLHNDQPNVAFSPLSNRYGLSRDAYHGSIGIDYDIPAYGITLSSLTAMDNQRYSELQDLANEDGSQYPDPFYGAPFAPYAQTFSAYPFFIEDAYRNLSQEVRITSDQHQRFRWLVGFNYEWDRTDSGGAGGPGLYTFTFGDAPTSEETSGVFFGLNYDILSNLTLTFDGRYQSDKERGFNNATSLTFKGTYNDFVPRVSLQYKPLTNLMAYATYSEGVNPGTFNANIPSLPASEQAVLAGFGAKVPVKPEHLDNYEVGVKGRFFHDTVTMSADVYYDIWYSQINVQNIDYVYNGELMNTSADLNDGKTDLKGLEADGQWRPIPHLEFNASGAINDTDIKAGGCYTCSLYTGTMDVDGNQLPDVSKYQATFGAEYGGSLSSIGSVFSSLPTWDWFARLDYIYKSGSYEDKDNLVKTPDENLVNLRAGLTSGPLRIEAFVDNLTNWSGPSTVLYTSLIQPQAGNLSGNNLVTGLPYLRTFGVRFRYKFGG